MTSSINISVEVSDLPYFIRLLKRVEAGWH